MAGQSIDLKYSIGDPVRIIELNRPGLVISIWILPKGIKYEVRYFWNGEAKEVYFYNHEIKPEKA